MNPFVTLAEVEEREIVPGFHGKMVHTDGLTVAHFRIEAGSILPEHHHVHEQVTNVIEGELEMTINGVTQVCKAGMVATIPPNVPHSGRALTDCKVVDVFRPTRADYR